ncbi:MAG: SpoIVB peptidase S55 domain-containing protein [Myxococcales bacterium]|nr:SpoIVB peptidase S55 domain-containing protein [Myxococcales bacterium]
MSDPAFGARWKICPLAALLWLLPTGAVQGEPALSSTGQGRPQVGPPPAARGEVPLLPLAQVRPGMTGYGLTVFAGTQPERFSVRVVGVLRHFLPRQDLIVIRSDDPRLLHSGIAAGMSGSPIYLEGRLAGALAYGWAFAKEPLAGVTPIENILAEMRRPPRGRHQTPLAALLRGEGPAPAEPSWLREPQDLARLLPPGLQPGDGRLVRASVPLSVAGLTPAAVAALAEAFAPYHLVPLQAGGAARPGARGPARFVPGGALAVELIRGDISAAGTGTVTYVEGQRVAAFGHPLLNIGEVYFPIATAEVLSLMPSQAQSFKLSSPLEEKGTLVQDRQACIVGDMGGRAEMVPVQVHIRAPGGPEQVFSAEVARHRFLTPLLTSTVATSAVQMAASDVADAVIQLRASVGVRGFDPLERTDYLFSPEGLQPRALLSFAGLKQLQELLLNPFAPVHIDRIDLDVSVQYRPDVAEIVGLSVASDELEPGTWPSLYVTLRPYNGRPYVRAIPFEVPRSLAGQTLKIEASAGNLARPEVAPPESLAGLVSNLRKGYPARSLVVTLQTPDEGVMLRGQLVPSLPASVIATLRPGTSSRRAEPYKRLARLVVDMGVVLQGRQEIQVRVSDRAP